MHLKVISQIKPGLRVEPGGQARGPNLDQLGGQ